MATKLSDVTPAFRFDCPDCGLPCSAAKVTFKVAKEDQFTFEGNTYKEAAGIKLLHDNPCCAFFNEKTAAEFMGAATKKRVEANIAKAEAEKAS